MYGLPECVTFERGAVRVDSGVRRGDAISPFYDSMVAKLITFAPTRNEAIAKMRRGLDEFIIEGIQTTIPFHKKMMEKRNKQFANFKGERHTLSPEYRKKMYKKRAKEFSSYKGDLLVRKRPTGSYPDMKYRGNRKNSSFEKKEK